VIDIFVTTKPGREDLTMRSIQSLVENTKDLKYRLTIYVDGVGHKGIGNGLELVPDHLIISNENDGLGPAINRSLAHIEATNRYYQGDQLIRAVDDTKVSDFVCYCQDDLEYQPGWLKRLVSTHLVLEDRYKLGFSSGLECVEHTTQQDIGNGMKLKKWIRAANMIARREYWMSMYPIPRFDPETRNIRAKPNNGVGSGVDWHFIRNHENSVDRTGRTCLVIPGLVRHIGYKESTWLNQELPESDLDKKAMGK